MKEIKLVIALHIILGPLCVLVIMDDAKHPEKWGDWWRNPANSVPYCLAMDAVIVGVLFLGWRKERRRTKGIRRLDEANRLRAEGKFEAAEEAFREAMRLLR